MFEDYMTLSGADLRAELDEIEFGLVMLDSDLDAGYGEFSGPWWAAGVSLATAKNYERLLAKLKEAKKKAKGGSKSAERQVARLQKRLAAIKAKKARQIARRKKRGKELTKKQEKFLAARKSRKKSISSFRQKKRISKVRSEAKKYGWPSDLSVDSKWLGDQKVKSTTIFTVLVYRAYSRSVKSMLGSSGLGFPMALGKVLSTVKKSEYREAVSAALRPYMGQLTAAANKYVAEKRGTAQKTTEDGTPIVSMRRVLPASGPAAQAVAAAGASNLYRTRPGLGMQARLAALRQQRAQMAAAQIEAQRAAEARQAELLRQQQAALAAQQQAQAAALARQRAALAAQLAQQRAAYQQQIQQTAAQERVIQSGAFQAFPHSSPISDEGAEDSFDSELEMDEDLEDEGMDEDGEGMDEGAEMDEFGESPEDGTPFYKNPIVLIGVAAAGWFGYQQMQKKKGKKKTGSTSPA
jgi:hypothetical protein